MRGEQFSGNRKRVAAGSPIAPLQFGPHGELTPKTIKAANLTKEEEKRAFEMLKVQAAFVEIMDVLSYPVDPDGNVHDLTAIKATKIAIAWTLALNGFRSSGKKYIKKRPFAAPGCYADAHTWVDVRSPDDAAEELEPEHKSSDQTLPPDTRRLAAIRDGDPGQKLPQWAVKPKIVYDDEPRPADLPERPKPEPAKPESA
jgi:hypothetical protein